MNKHHHCIWWLYEMKLYNYIESIIFFHSFPHLMLPWKRNRKSDHNDKQNVFNRLFSHLRKVKRNIFSKMMTSDESLMPTLSETDWKQRLRCSLQLLRSKIAFFIPQNSCSFHYDGSSQPKERQQPLFPGGVV